MKNLLPLLVILSVALFACSTGDSPPAESSEEVAKVNSNNEDEGHDSDEEQALLHRSDPSGTYGTGIHGTETSTIPAILQDPATYEGKTVHVSGEVTEVCPRRGCWIDIADPETGETIRVKVTDGDIVFPLSAQGSKIEVEGTVQRLELDEAQAKNWKQHEAEERGEEFDPASVEGPMVIWRIMGTGAEIKEQS
jgi:hypothetical protein